MATSGYYTYFMSSLPLLRFGMRLPFSFEKFQEMCERVIAESDIEIIKNAAEIEKPATKKIHPTEKKWRKFDRALRNELAKVRAARKHTDPAKYLRRDGYSEPAITHMALNAYRNPLILESEKTLDEERWRMLEDISVGHYFDLDSLLVYAHKLLILEKWEKVNTADESQVLESALQKV